MMELLLSQGTIGLLGLVLVVVITVHKVGPLYRMDLHP